MNKRPNILWVSFEDTNPFYGCYGDKVARTPNLDKLASEGCVWTNCFSTAGVCAPARSAVITGMYPISIGTHHMRTTHANEYTQDMPTPYSAVVPHYVKCFSEYLRREGYYCTNNSKTDYQFDAPFTAWDECSNKAHWRNRPNQDQPFFAVFNPTRTHESGMWDERELEITFKPEDIQLPPYFPDTLEVRKSMARMYTLIERSDKEFGELLQQLEEDGLMENTYIFHWSDHGPMPRGKRWPYDSGIHVPMIVKGPGIEYGTILPELVSTVDLAPTVLSLCDIDIPQYMQGKAFLGAEKEETRKYVYASRDRHDECYDMVRAIRSDKFKYMRHYYPGIAYNQWVPYLNKHPIMKEMWRLHLDGKLDPEQSLLFEQKPAEELYDIENDPHEINNLAKDPAFTKELKVLREELDQWLSQVGDLGKITEKEMVSGWYPDGNQPETQKPEFIAIEKKTSSISPLKGELQLKDKCLMQLHCSTQGSSLAYRFGDDEGSSWKLYTKAFDIPEDVNSITVKAARIGYKESEENTLLIKR